jgi:hypothetical protein
MNSFKMRRNMKMKEIMKKNEITAILFINLRVYEKLNCLMNDWVSHSMNNSIVYEESFSSTKKARVSREANNAMIEDQRFYWLTQ